MNPNPASCLCAHPWQQLFTVISGLRYEVVPAPALTPTSALFRAWCSDCGIGYPHPFQIELLENPCGMNNAYTDTCSDPS